MSENVTDETVRNFLKKKDEGLIIHGLSPYEATRFALEAALSAEEPIVVENANDDLAAILRETTEAMANLAVVDMELWNRHSNACLKAAAALSAGQTQEPEAEDHVCLEADGCPTEIAVLKRFWRAHQGSSPTPVPVSSQAVEVKTLEWDRNGSWSVAKSLIGHYTIRPCLATNFEGQWLLWRAGEEASDKILHPSEDAAKAAAQSDYEARIIAALVAPVEEEEKDGS